MLTFKKCLTVISLLLLAFPSLADPLQDFKAALKQLPAESPLTAQISAKVMYQQGEGDKAMIREGEAQVRVTSDHAGMRLYYTPEALQQMSDEKQRENLDADAETPFLTAVDQLQPTILKRSLSAAGDLLRLIEGSQYKGSERDTYEGTPARKLTFAFGLEKVPERQKRFVKEFTSEVAVWIDDNGIPLGSHSYTRFSGSAFIFIRFRSSSDEVRHYQRIDDRLLMVYSRQESEIAGAGEYAANHIEHTITPLGK